MTFLKTGLIVVLKKTQIGKNAQKSFKLLNLNDKFCFLDFLTLRSNPVSFTL